MRWGYFMIFALFAVIGVAVVRTYQLNSEASESTAPSQTGGSLTISRVTPTRSSANQIQPTPLKATPIPPTPVPPTQPHTNGAPPNGAMIKWVDIPSAANKVGIKQFDVITVFDGTPVDPNHFLADLIASKRPGDYVDITIVRGGQTLVLKAQLRGSPSDNNVAYLGVQYVQQGSAPPENK